VTFAEQIGRNLRRVRREAFMSQEDLSRRAGLDRSEICLLERGLRIPRIDTCIKILESAQADSRGLSEGIAWHEPVRFDEGGWFTISGLDGPVDLRPPRRKGVNR
jgi:transcriptional regulator with XRE-family HTH domain